MLDDDEIRSIFDRVGKLEAAVAVGVAERAAIVQEQHALRRLAERNDHKLQDVLKAFEQLASSQKLASDQAFSALTIVQNALVLMPANAPPLVKPPAPTE